MPIAEINGLSLAYEVVGDSGQPWVITPGGRFTKESPGVRELAAALAEHGNKVLIWDRPNCGESDLCFEGSSESAMQADALAGLLDAPRHDSDDHRRRFRWRPGVAPHRGTASRDGGRAGHLVDQWRRLRPPLVGDALLRRIGAGGVDAGHGGRG